MQLSIAQYQCIARSDEVDSKIYETIDNDGDNSLHL